MTEWKPDEDEKEYLVVPKKAEKDEESKPLTRAEEHEILDRIFGGHTLNAPEDEDEDV